MKYTLYYDSSTPSDRLEHLSFRLSMYVDGIKEFSEKAIVNSETKRMALYISDEQLKTILPFIIDREITIAILPHPDNRSVCTGWGVDFDLDKAIEHFITLPEPISIDLLLCNERPVFNNIVVGQSFQLATDKQFKQLGFFRRLRNSFEKFINLRPFSLKITTHPDKEIKTAVSGIVIVQHGRSSLLSRLMIKDSFVNDGKFHAFFISPRSFSGLLLFALQSWYERSKLPPYAAHIKTKVLSLSGGEPFAFTEDGISLNATTLELKMAVRALTIIPGSHLSSYATKFDSHEIYKVASLPRGETAQLLTQKRLPLIEHASTGEFKELFQVLRENAKTKGSYLVLMVLSTLLATLGLFANSTSVVIGAMILAPLMAPIISLSMGALRQDTRLIINSLKTIIAGLGFALSCAVFVTWMVPLYGANEEILSRTRPNLLDLGIAVVSGMAGAYAHAREEVAKTLAGVAIAVALVPPVAVAGIGIGQLDYEIFFGAFLLLLTNLGGIVLAGSLTFLFLGFSPFNLAKKGVIISTLVVVLLSVPLGFGFYRMMYENNIVQQLENWKKEEIIIKDVSVQRTKPLVISMKLVSDHTLSDEEIETFKNELEERLGQEVQLEITIAVLR